MARYQVVGAMVSAKVDTIDGVQVRYFYAPAVLPDGVAQESIDHLLDVGLIAVFGESSVAEPDDTEKAPGKSASKATWVEYAVSQGMDATEAEALTRDDLAEKFGDPANSGS